MSYGKSLTAFEVEDDCGRTVKVTIDDSDINDQLVHVLADKLGGDENTWAIAVDAGLITPDSIDGDLSEALDDYCHDCAMEKLYE